MDIDEQDCGRSGGHEAEEMNKLRLAAASPSPSALSTTSSGSPLVRGSSSSGAGKRPAPTSIAAAQLQCQQQQQQQLEFSNKMLGAKRSHGKQSSRLQPPAAPWAADATRRTPVERARSPAPSARKSAKVGGEKGAENGPEHSKSLGYSVAKSIAFRAYRFNEFWSVNKMRYLNLACLLMTLICLVTILLFNGNNSATTTTTSPIATSTKLAPATNELTASDVVNRRSHSSSSQQAMGPFALDGPESNSGNSENLDSLNSQPLVGGNTAELLGQASAQNPSHDTTSANKQVAPATASSSANDNDSVSSSNGRADSKSWARRKFFDHPMQGDREIEETTSNTLGQPAPITESVSGGADWPPSERWLRFSGGADAPSKRPSPVAGDFFAGPQSPGSLIEPILSQIFKDMEMGNPFLRPLRHLVSSTLSANRTSSSPGAARIVVMKPVIRRSKNGATIVISGSSSFANDSMPMNLNDSSLPSLIEKLIPPMLMGRPMPLVPSGASPMMMMMTMMRPSALSAPEVMANTTNVTAEPLLAPSSPAVRLLNPLDPFAAPQHSSNHAHHHRLFMDPLGVFRSPFGPMPFLAPPQHQQPGLLGMLMRQMASDAAADDDGPPFGHIFASDRPHPFMSPPQASFTILAGDKEHQHPTLNNKNDTAGQATSHNSSASSISRQSSMANDQELDALDSVSGSHLQSHLHRPHPFGPSISHSNFYPHRALVRGPAHQAGSMLIFSSSAEPSAGASVMGPEPSLPFPPGGPFGPFMGGLMPPMSPLPPHMVLLGSNNNADGPSGPLNPILRSILNNAMSDLGPAFQPQATGDSRNSSAPGQQQAKPVASRSNSAASAPSPNWSTGPQSSIDPDDEWTSADNLDRWDEQTQSRHLLARHRDSDSDMEPNGPMDPTDFVTGLQLDQQAAAAAGPPLLESIRQTIRGPGLTVERIIEVPQGRVASGVKSQSLSRLDYDENDGQPSGRMRPIFAHRPIDGRSDEQQPPPIGFIGRLLSDLARNRDQQSPMASARMGRGRALMDEDLDEGDSSEETLQRPPPTMLAGWPKIRVASARIRMRPLAIAEPRSASGPGSPETMVFMAPAHMSIPAEPDSQSFNELREANFMQPTEHKSTSGSLEDTLNSMEDRLNHVLSMAGPKQSSHEHEDYNDNRHASRSHHTRPEVAFKQANDLYVPPQVPQMQPRGIIPQPTNHAQQQSKIHQHQQVAGDNPFTSPSSPLFGFPASSSAAQNSSQDPASKLQKHQVPATSSGGNNNNNKQNQQPGANRQQRSFTYHSNHEIAQPFAVATADKQMLDTETHQDQSMGRARFLGPFAPADVVMGRRLDDQPAAYADDDQQSAQGSSSQATAHAIDSTGPSHAKVLH